MYILYECRIEILFGDWSDKDDFQQWSKWIEVIKSTIWITLHI